MPALLAMLVGGALAGSSVAAQDLDLTAIPSVPRDYRPALTSWREPDLRGTWPVDHLNFTPLQRPPEQADRYFLNDAEYAARQQMLAQRGQAYATEIEEETIGMGHWVEPGTANRRTSFVIDPPNGRLPALTAEGQRRAALKRSSYLPGQTYDWVTDFDIWDRCISRGLPASMFPFNYNNGMRIFQSPGLVAIQMEMVHETRLIPTDGRPALPAAIGHWLGESRGHWEDGNTLVVETTNFHPDSSPVNVGTWGSPPGNNTPQSEQARLVERFTMTGSDTITYEATYNDPVIFTAPWTVRLDWQRDEDYRLFEYACHEGNVQIRGYITSSRAERGIPTGKEAE
jgi:hypothetical protein